jgi:nitroreductase
MDSLIETLQWRYAVKQYDKDKKITPELLENLKEVLRLVPTSNGLQPFKFLIIESENVREELKKHSFNQSQITDASHLLVFCSYKQVNEKQLDSHVELHAKVQDVPIENLSNYAFHLKKTLLNRSDEQTLTSNEKQCYIALGQLLQAAAIYNIDASPMEGFSIEAYNEVLNLEDKNLSATVVCALGYRSEKDKTQHRKKVRKEKDDLFESV